MSNKHKKIRAILVFFLTLIIQGCATSDSFRNTPDAKLCIDYMTFPSFNIWQGAREEEIARRNLDCSPYVSIAANKRRANEDLEDSLRDLRDNY